MPTTEGVSFHPTRSLLLRSLMTGLVPWLLVPFLPMGLMFSAGYCYNTDKIEPYDARLAAMIIILVVGAVTMSLPYYWIHRYFKWMWGASEHVGPDGAALKLFLSTISLVWLLGYTVMSFMTGFFVAATYLEAQKQRIAWGCYLAASLALYTARCVFDALWVLPNVDNEWTPDTGKRLSWGRFNIDLLPEHRQRDLNDRGLTNFQFPTFNLMGARRTSSNFDWDPFRRASLPHPTARFDTTQGHTNTGINWNNLFRGSTAPSLDMPPATHSGYNGWNFATAGPQWQPALDHGYGEYQVHDTRQYAGQQIQHPSAYAAPHAGHLGQY